MTVAAPSLTTSARRDKLVTAADAIRLIRDGDTVFVNGFMGQGFPEELVLELERRYLADATPRDLRLVFPVAVGDQQGRGIDHLTHPGLLARVIAGHWGMSPALQKLAVDGDIEAYNIPQGVLTQLLRESAGGRPGLLTSVGLGTFADPRNGGGKINDATTDDLVDLMEIDGAEYLFYRAPRLDVALLRGTTADADGNITMEREGLTLDALAAATAVHNAGGLVIVQVERVAARGTLDPRLVRVPGVLVDCVVQVDDPAHHMQTLGTAYAPGFSGELREPTAGGASMKLDPRKVIARRAALELRPGSVVNLGVGMPEGIAAVANEEGVLHHLTLTAEPGVIGGFPQGGLNFGCSRNPDAILDQSAQFDFYDGGGLDAAFLGMAQADKEGNVNVSRFGSRLAGSGGFVNISQNAKQLIFVGTFLAPGRTSVVDGAMVADTDSATAKFVDHVEQVTFSGAYAAQRGQSVLYITDRGVFTLGTDGLELIEIAPGLDVDRDILAHLSFTPKVSDDLAVMDERIFADAPMGLERDLLEIPFDSRFAYDAQRNLFFLNLEGLSLSTAADVDTIADAVERHLADVGRRVNMVINYDNFAVAPDVYERYLSAIESLAQRFYDSAVRYTTSSFLRLKLSEGLGRRGFAPHVYESAAEAGRWGDLAQS